MQVELEGEFLAEPLHIVDWRETTLRKRAINQVKVQWKNFGPDEATWEEEEFMWKTYPVLFLEIINMEIINNTKDSVPHMGGDVRPQYA